MPTEVVPGVHLDTVRAVLCLRLASRCRRIGVDMEELEHEVIVKLLLLARGRSPFQDTLSTQFAYVQMVALGVFNRLYRQQRSRAALFKRASALYPELLLSDATRNIDDGGADLAIVTHAARGGVKEWRSACSRLELPQGRGRMRRARIKAKAEAEAKTKAKSRRPRVRRSGRPRSLPR